MLVIFSSFFITVYLIAFRRTLKSISKLQAGIKVIGSGNLDYSLETSKQDEIGELSDAFNQMTANLKTVTTSKTELENEIAERKKVEEELRKAEEITRSRTEELEKTRDKLEEYANQMEAIAEERARQLKDAERLAAIGATAGMVGHDIRNPLQTVTGELYLAKSELQNMPDGIAKKNLKENLDIIGEQTIYVNKIVSDLQDYAKPLTPKLEETDLKKIVQSVLSTVDIPENVKVKQSIDKDFPKLKIDQSYMQRILQNLTNNAVQAMPNGGKLTINLAIVAEKAVISVEDTGEGIPMDVRGKLFTPLITTKAKGQGFGLAVVKRLTEALNGSVTFDSEVGKGTKFIIELPF